MADDEITHITLLDKINENHFEVTNRLTAIESTLTHNSNTANGLKEDSKENKQRLHELETKISTGIIAVRIVAWIGGGLVATWGAFTAWVKTFGG